MTGTLTVRRMMREDLQAVAELEKVCFSEPWSLALLSDSLHRKEYLFLVAEVEEPDGDSEVTDPEGGSEGAETQTTQKRTAATRIAGYLGARTVLDEMEIANVAVFPEYRKQGVGEAMLTELLSIAGEMDLFGVTLEVRVGNAPAIHLYEKLGFTREGIRPGFYSKPVEDALIFWKYMERKESAGS